MKYLIVFFFIGYIFLLASCKKDSIEPNSTHDSQYKNWKDTLIINPSSYSPLTALYSKKTAEPTTAEIEVISKNPLHSNQVEKINSLTKFHNIPILGLYPNFNNIVVIRFYNVSNLVVQTDSLFIKTDSLPPGMPEIIVDKKIDSEFADGMNLVSYWGNRFPQSPFIFDEYGEIRWLLDYREHPFLANLSYDNGIERLRNGNYYFGDISTAKIYEVDVFGNVLNDWGIPGYEFHHNVQEMSNGNFLVTTSKNNSLHLNNEPTIEDYVIEIDRSTGSILVELDLKQSLDENRTAQGDFFRSSPIDWFHGNAVIEDNNNIIVSGRTQGIVSLDRNNRINWILNPHKGWGVSRDSVDLNNFLLTPLDANEQAITDTMILNGYTNHPNFEWPWYQHAPKLLPNGDLLVFDNGDNRNYQSNIEYSRAVIYRINESNKTIKQIWSYGKLRGKEAFGQYVSDVDYLETKNNVLFSPGFSTNNNGINGGKIIEVDYPTKRVVFEAWINPPPGSFVAFHRAERLSLYP